MEVTAVSQRNNNFRPLGIRKTIQLMVILTILAWATQTLFHQWGFGAEIDGPDASADVAATGGSEKFVPGEPRYAGAVLEVRAEATVVGTEVTLKQVCRWSNADAAVFTPIADLVLTRLDARAPFKAIGVAEIKAVLHDAGVNLAVIRFAGTTACTVGRSDIQLDERAALDQWIAAREGKELPAAAAPTTKPAQVAATSAQPVLASASTPAAAAPAKALAAAPKPFHTLRELLIADLADRTAVPADSIQMHFNPKDEKLLTLSEPLFRFNLEPRRARNLGDVSWDVLIVTDSGSQKAPIAAVARAWQEQVVVTKPLAYKQIIQESDVLLRRALIDRVGDEVVLKPAQIIGNQAASDLKPGSVLTARNVEAVPLVKNGQLVTVTLAQGNVQVKTVARAMEGGAFGQTVRVRNESTKDVFDVTITGPQTATLSASAVIPPPKVASADRD